MTIIPLNGNYEGKLSADGNTITGNWSQGLLPQHPDRQPARAGERIIQFALKYIL